MPPRIATTLSIVLILGYFFYSAWGGLLAGLSTDDLMNLHGYWLKPWRRIVLDNVLFFQPSYRPMGAIFYLPIFHLFGLDPLPYRIVSYLLLLANLCLLGKLVKILSGSGFLAFAAVMIASYHPALAQIYFDSGTIYDLLCFFFYFGALCYYTSIRSTGRTLNWTQAAMVVVLYICALNSKEMAISLPLILIAYEWIHHAPAVRDPRHLTQWTLEKLPLGVFTALITAPYVVGKTSASSTFSGLPTYEPSYSVSWFLANYGEQLQRIFFLDDAIPAAWALLLLVALILTAWISGNKTLQLAWLLAVVGFVPTGFIPSRGGYAFYLPLAGWSIFAACLPGSVFRLLPRYPTRSRPIAEIALLAVTAILLVRAYRVQRSWVISPQHIPYPGIGMQHVVHSIIEQLDVLLPEVRRGARILFVHDPFGADFYTLTHLCQLRYRDPTLVVDRNSIRESPATRGEYDAVIQFEGRNLKMIAGVACSP